MGVISPYFTDYDIVTNLRQYYNRNEQYTINYKCWLNSAKYTDEGIIIQIKNRKFLIDKYTGVVLQELRQ